jgi:hypothetical protein
MHTGGFELGSSVLTSSTLKWLHRIQCGFKLHVMHVIFFLIYFWVICQLFLIKRMCRGVMSMIVPVELGHSHSIAKSTKSAHHLGGKVGIWNGFLRWLGKDMVIFFSNSRPWLRPTNSSRSRPWLTISRPWLTISRPWLTNSRPWLLKIFQAVEQFCFLGCPFV